LRSVSAVLDVHEVRPDEMGALGEVTYEAYAALDGYLEEEYALELKAIDRRAAIATVLVAVEGDDVVGGVTYVDDPANPYAEFTADDEAGFRMLAVAPHAQGRGVGEELVHACIARARRAGKRRLVLHSTPWMHAAHSLYLRVGFRRAHELDWLPVPEIPLWGFVYDLVP
jgi:GNAT superfamily N-acetyltransferase